MHLTLCVATEAFLPLSLYEGALPVILFIDAKSCKKNSPGQKVPFLSQAEFGNPDVSKYSEFILGFKMERNVF